MKTHSLLYAAIVIVAFLFFCSSASAQCEAYMLACLDVDNPSGVQELVITIWTGDLHCLASGNIDVMQTPPDGVILGPYEPVFDNVFSSYYTVRIPVTGNTMHPPGTIVGLDIAVSFDDPGYSALETTEIVYIVDPTGRLDQFRPTPCFDSVPPFMLPMTAACFHVCHKIYRVHLQDVPMWERPVITVSPGCTMDDPCIPDACVPGGETDYRWGVDEIEGEWYLEFEYSNASLEPVCYCVSYTGTSPYTTTNGGLLAVDELWQTADLTLWNMDTDMCGLVEIFSYPPGAWTAPYTSQLFAPVGEKRTLQIPVGAMAFMPGQAFQLIAYVEPEIGLCDSYDPVWYVEDVMVTPEGGLEIVDVGGECSDVQVPTAMGPGMHECFKVCHDIYHIILQGAEDGIPEITVTPGCGSPTLCPDLPGCVPGGPTDYRYDVYRIGGTWMLEFEYSNPNTEPVCYCVAYENVNPEEKKAYLLAALDEASQTLDVSLWTSDCGCDYPASGIIIVSDGPYEIDPEAWIESFFDVFCEPRHWEVPVNPGDHTAGENFQYEVAVDFFGPGSDPFDGIIYYENVTVTPTGELAQWYPQSPCTGDNVPPLMSLGESACFEVCHRVYDILLGPGIDHGEPIIGVEPGCALPCDNAGCMPGGPYDYCYHTWFDGVNWHLEFEYSNPEVEPVCYCVTYEGDRPNCDPHVLAALDERDQELQVTLWMTGDEDPPCETNALVSICRSDQIGSIEDIMTNVDAYGTTVSVPAESGGLPPGSNYQYVVAVDFDDPYEDVLITEEVIVGPTGLLEIDDTGAECTGDNVPSVMPANTAACFEVCHRIYHIDILGAGTELPLVTVIPGCLPSGPCEPYPECTPGGEYDYCYQLIWQEDHWELEFEYSNEMIEPVCYCVTVEAGETGLYGLIAIDELNQTVDLTLWNTTGVEICGLVDFYSIPPGVWIGPYNPDFVSPESRVTLQVPVGAGVFTPGQQFELHALVQHAGGPCDPYPDREFIDDVIVTPEGGLRIADTGGQCTDDHVPLLMNQGDAECIKVCHRIYHIDLGSVYNGIPNITVTPGCGPPTSCPDLPGCTPGGPDDYRYDIFQAAGMWYLEFEYSNPNIEPVCYCVEFTSVTPTDTRACMLTSLDEENQTLDVTLWTNVHSCERPASGTITVSKGPYELDPDAWVESFFDVFYIPWHHKFPVTPGTYTTGQNFQFEVVADFFGPGSDPFDGVISLEHVTVDPTGMLQQWYPQRACTGDNVPLSMSCGQSICFEVCHKIYDVLLNTGPTPGEPLIRVAPGCDPPCDNPGCTPGGANDYRYRVWYDGVTWHLEFEYSNVYREPVCYCVTYEGTKPQSYTHELVALDERDQMLDMTMWMTGSEEPPTLIPVDVVVCRTDQPYTVISVGSFILDRYDEYLTVSIPADNGGNPPGTAFQYVVHFDYNDPFDDVLITEEVMVRLDGLLEIDDVGGECVGDNVPPYMDPYEPYCFHVCHKVYHVDLNIFSTRKPLITIMPGCDPPCDDPGCVPGGIYDYRYDLVWLVGHWELEFEYSNENTEPVCYCVIVEPDLTPPIPVNDLALNYQFEELAVPMLHFYWEAPEAGTYTIYYSTDPNNQTDPPDPSWTDFHTDYYMAGVCHWSAPMLPAVEEYRIFVIQYTP